MEGPEMRGRAIRRIKAKRDFRQHQTVYLAVNLLLNVIWAVTDLGGYYWPVWPLLGWGIGILAHARDAYGRPREITEREIDREMELLSRSS